MSPDAGATDLSELPEQFAVADDDHAQRKDEAGDEERDDEGVIVEVSRIPAEGHD